IEYFDLTVKVIQVLISGLALILALRALSTWRHNREHEAADNCVGAAYGLLSAFHRYIDAVENSRDERWTAYTEMWASWSRFRVAYMVARRYYSTKLQKEYPD